MDWPREQAADTAGADEDGGCEVSLCRKNASTTRAIAPKATDATATMRGSGFQGLFMLSGSEGGCSFPEVTADTMAAYDKAGHGQR